MSDPEWLAIDRGICSAGRRCSLWVFASFIPPRHPVTRTSPGIDQAAGPLQAGGNMEGKEVRFGISGSALFANVTTASADGAVKCHA